MTGGAHVHHCSLINNNVSQILSEEKRTQKLINETL